MKVLLSWMREFCPTEVPAQELAGLLTHQGAKVESVSRPWEGLSGVIVARVLEVRDHPNSDKLCLARASYGSGERELVVGVRNMRPGDLVALAGPGASVPARPEPLGAREIRGVVSEGMLCSPWELGISPDHGGILILPPDTPLGADVKALFGLDDVLFDIEVKSNRPDLLSVVGVAREAAAATGTAFTPPSADPDEGDEKAADMAFVRIEDLERCPRYVARVIRDVRIDRSPIAVQARLTALGMRPVSNVVDATNYVMLEMGQPMHPFDLSLLAGPGIVVRRAEEGERLVTLDDVERILTAEDLIIADLEKAVGIAGVMGSAAAEVAPTTTEVLLESATFDWRSVLRTSQRLGLVTEASIRFSRGADPEGADAAAARAASLMVEWGGGTVLAGAAEDGAAPERRRVTIRPARTSLLLGYAVSAHDAKHAFRRLGMEALETDGDALEVTIPGYRPDLRREVDLIEEVARVQGYERTGSTLPGIRQPGGVPDSYHARRRVREAMVRAGLRETTTYSFASRADLELMGEERAVAVANPLAADEAFLRVSLVPGLLRGLSTNVRRQVPGAALFEVGHVFHPGDPVDEREHVGVVLGGQASRGFPDPPRSFDFLDAKGALEALLHALGADDWRLEGGAELPLHPGRSAHVVVRGKGAGVVGELHPRVAAELDLPERTSVLELEVAALGGGEIEISYRDIPRFPPVRRDLAFVVDASVPAGAVRAAILEAGAPFAVSSDLFDVFTGPPVPVGRKSLAFSVDFRVPDRTLTDEEIEPVTAAIVGRLAAEFGAELRSG